MACLPYFASLSVQFFSAGLETGVSARFILGEGFGGGCSTPSDFQVCAEDIVGLLGFVGTINSNM